ncbi:MAG: glycosyltransferase family 9 protein, partial [Planctomycetota bacterium]
TMHNSREQAESPPKNILIIRLGAMGDIILSSGVIRDIRQSFPNAKIYMLTQRPFVKLLSRNPDIDEILVDPRPHRLKFWAFWPVIKKLRSLNIDRVYDIQDKPRTQLYHKWIQPVEWVGSARGCSHPVPKQVKANTLTLQKKAGQMRAGGIEPVHAMKPDARWLADPVDDVLAELDVPERFILLVPGSSMKNPDRRWPYYGELAERLQAEGYTCVTVPGPDELDLCESIPATMLMRTGADGSKTSLTYFELAGVACKAHYAIGNDTGPSHITARCGAPGLGLFGKATLAQNSGFDTVWSVIQTNDLNTLSVDEVLKRAIADLEKLK